ncbi:MAG TPA: class I tRNA ligase family protein [Acidimicrobiales bacterium]|nr:class I tRNA ligase family protein [Acidimicrobiales bacterium]
MVASKLPYDPHEIEDRWRHHWRREGTGLIPSLDDVEPADVFYNLVEFPYPSAEGLHVGHVFKYSGADAFGRYQRMRGRAVFQPMGWDAFGIHTENFALKHGQHPMRLTGRTTENFHAQLSRGGMAWDWRYALDTSKPQYYRWTQWLLVRRFEAGLLYQAEAPVTWCPSCLTVLAREQTETVRGESVCERCTTPVTERVLTQWFLRITAYADRLVDGLDALDWPERAKRLQRQWIGRSQGREIDFPLAPPRSGRADRPNGSTSPPRTIGVFTTRPDTIDGVTFLAVPVGSPLAGSTVVHPRTGAELPVLEADYVVGDYGTGAVMGVPAQDERDARFAAEHGLPVVDAPPFEGEIGRPATRYRLRDWLISRQRYWGPPIPIVHCPTCGPVAVPEEELPVVLPDLDEFRPTGTGVSPLAASDAFVRTTCPRCDEPARRETDVSDTFVDSSWYFLRYPSADKPDVAWDDERTRRFLPVDFYAGGPEHVQRHHLYARFVTMALHDLGLVPFEEPFPRIRLGGLIIKDGARMSKSRGNVISPDDYVRRHGSDVLRCALLFSAPWEQGGDFVDDAIGGIERFFTRVWKLASSAVQGRGAGRAAIAPDRRPVDAAIVRATDAIERLRFNVALAATMELIGWLEDHGPGLSAEDRRDAVRTLILLLAPLAPHLAEELWSRNDGKGSVHVARWPEPRAARSDDEVELVVQVDGRVRDRVTVASGLDEDAAVAAALARPKVAGALDGRAVLRSVHVPDRLVNLVT